MQTNCYVLLPAYNEGLVISGLLNSLIEYDSSLNIVVVDDGSTDSTASKVKEMQNNNIHLVQHESNKGLGCAVKTGFNYILDKCNDFDIIITMDADGTHSIDHFSGLIENIKRGYDCVIASRFTAGGEERGVAWHRRILSSAAGRIIKLLFSNSAGDYSSGFRSYNAGIMKKMRNSFGENYIQEKGFSCMAEILLKLFKIDAKVKEIPLILRYDLKQGKSKIKILETIFAYFRMFVRVKTSSIK
ncbi:glycosyltransferase family 2 protein [bacterium]